MKAEIVMIGTELLLGQIQDTNATHIAQELAEHGINLYQKSTVGDNAERIKATLDAGLNRSDVLICSGGLGPTADDITRECIAELLDRPLEFQEELYEELKAKFATVGRKMTDNNKKQSYLPRGAQAIPNPVGSAPGVLLEDGRGIIICMPGVPSELKLMLKEQVLPYLRQKFGVQGVLHYKVLKVCGYGESFIDTKIDDLIADSQNPTVGLLASPEFVRIRIAAKAESIEAANALMQPVIDELYARLPDMIMGENDTSLEQVVDELLQKRAWRIAIWETNTGGMLAQRLVSAGAKSFAHGEIAPVEGLDAQTLLDVARRFQVESGVESALVMLANPKENRTEVVFISPEGEARWDIGYYGCDALRQLRTAVVGLEHVRRFLIKKKP